MRAVKFSNSADTQKGKTMPGLANEIFEFREGMHEQGVMFCYSGYMSEQILSGIGHAMKSKLTVEKVSKSTVRSVFSVFVELMQNVIRYSNEAIEPLHADDPDMKYGVLIVGKTGQRYFITCGNLIDADKVEPLRAALDEINGLGKEELKKVYMAKLRSESPEGSKGAGVGFIDVVRRSTGSLEYDFRTVNDKESFFCVKAYI